ncbi:MAG: sigma factor regulator FecR, partial [Dehalococcoidia bacterium]|nr:sigma factor regulator FecR [Dehalococcoidia bacterium]
SLPPNVVEAAEHRSSACDLFLMIGSSLAVYPAALMPRHALKAGAKLVIVNLTPTPLDDKAEVLIREKAGVALPRIVERVRQELAT